MQAAKDAVKSFVSKDGKHDTKVHESVNPAVTNETVHQQQEERIHPAVDKEVHQDHYHTSVQPVHDKEVLPEQHHHRAGNVEHRQFEHGDHTKDKDLHVREAAQFHDQSTRVQGETTRTVQPTVGAEHVHHHVHEQIQPVVHKQTIEPHVVHTTQPVHEVHHNESKHHQTTTLPAVGIDEFKKGGGILSGREERVDAFDGCPKGAHMGDRNDSLVHKHNQTANRDSVLGSESATTTGTTHEKPSLMDKLNPKKDADHDGVKGFMK